ncbi:MAG: hypothetical protein IT462_00605 [Planctomycetes bacterium]|nr:hypothetical protein [Planctomycetota bacterium]
MVGALNIAAALLLTVMPVLAPCNCVGFEIQCRCAIHNLADNTRAEAPPQDHCCGHCHNDKARDDDKSQDDHGQPLPAPKQSGQSCQASYDVLSSGGVITGVDPVEVQPGFTVLSALSVLRIRPRGAFVFSVERPPPKLALLRTVSLRI